MIVVVVDDDSKECRRDGGCATGLIYMISWLGLRLRIRGRRISSNHIAGSCRACFFDLRSASSLPGCQCRANSRAGHATRSVVPGSRARHMGSRGPGPGLNRHGASEGRPEEQTMETDGGNEVEERARLTVGGEGEARGDTDWADHGPPADRLADVVGALY